MVTECATKVCVWWTDCLQDELPRSSLAFTAFEAGAAHSKLSSSCLVCTMRSAKRGTGQHTLKAHPLSPSTHADMHTCPPPQVTPDGQRTMRTSLCASMELNAPELLPAGLGAAAAGLLHCEVGARCTRGQAGAGAGG